MFATIQAFYDTSWKPILNQNKCNSLFLLLKENAQISRASQNFDFGLSLRCWNWHSADSWVQIVSCHEKWKYTCPFLLLCPCDPLPSEEVTRLHALTSSLAPQRAGISHGQTKLSRSGTLVSVADNTRRPCGKSEDPPRLPFEANLKMSLPEWTSFILLAQSSNPDFFRDG